MFILCQDRKVNQCSAENLTKGFFSSWSHGHLVFILFDPPDWGCADPGAERCSGDSGGMAAPDPCPLALLIWSAGRESICGGGEVVFNTTHPNYFPSLLVENLWICNDVSKILPIFSTHYT